MTHAESLASYRQFKRRLALAMHKPYFELAEWPAREIMGWWERDGEAPIGELRMDWMHASLCHAIAAFSMCGTKHNVRDFMLWPDAVAETRREQTVEEAAAVMRKAAAIVKRKS